MSIVKIVVIGLVLAVLVTLVEEVQTRTILLRPLGSLLRSSRKQLRRAFGSQAGSLSSVPPSNPTDEEETVFSCAVGVHSKMDEQRLNNLKSWYQIPDEFNPRLEIGRAHV